MSLTDTDATRQFEPVREKRTLGILFVHGIGEQREGDTLTAFGEPLLDWIRQWISGHGQWARSEPIQDDHRRALDQAGHSPDGVDVVDASLFPSLRQSADPPCSRIHLRFKSKSRNEKQQHQEWLLAESWWGEQVQAPNVFALLGWMFSRGPWVIIAHFAERAMIFTRRSRAASARRQSRIGKIFVLANWRHVIWLLSAIQFLVFSLSLQLALVAATVVALIPIPAVKRYVSAVLQSATSILGDSYGLVANDTQRSAILTRFKDSVEWLKVQCANVVIVAHSQGAAVVHEAINDDLIDAPDLLITFGAGLVKLAQLRQCETHRRARLMAAGWIVPSLAVGTMLNVWIAQTTENLWFYVPSLVAIYLIAFGCTVAALSSWWETRIQTREAAKLRGAPKRWVDLYASSDPVPQGCLNEHLPRYCVESERIINRRSFLSDHTAYWENKPGFVTRLVAELNKQAKLFDIPELQDSAKYKRAQRHHRDAITVLSIGWWFFVLSLVAWGGWRRPQLSELGQGALSALAGTPLEFISASIKAPGAAIAWITERLTGTTPAFLVELGYASVALAGAAMIGYLWWKAVLVVFTKWNSVLLRDFMAYESDQLWGEHGAKLVWPFMSLLALLPPAIAFCLWIEINPWLYVIKAASLVILTIYSVLAVLLTYEQLPKSPSALLTSLDSLTNSLGNATLPGADDQRGVRGWQSWTHFRRVAGLWLVLIVLAGVALENILGIGSSATRVAVGISSLAITALLLARLVRLVVQRGYAMWIAVLGSTTIVAAILAWLAGALSYKASTLEIGVLTALMTAPLSGLLYFLTDKLLPARRKR